MADTVRERLARAVRSRREALGLTQEAAAERCGVSVRYWRALEAAKPAVSLDVADKVLVGLDWSWHDLADQLEPAGTGVPPGLGRQVERAWTRATAREKELLQGVIKVLGQGKR